MTDSPSRFGYLDLADLCHLGLVVNTQMERCQMAFLLGLFHSPTHIRDQPPFQQMCIASGVFFPLPCVECCEADHPPTSRILKASTFARQDTNGPLDLQRCVSSFKHSTAIPNAEKALIASENTTPPRASPFKQQSLEFHFLHTGTQQTSTMGIRSAFP